MAEQTESNWTESRFRQRLVGASVVVALAVLLLPLWLDGSGIDSLRVQSVPEKPAVEGAEAIDIPQPPGDSGEPLDQPPGALFPDQTPIEARPEGEGESMSQSPDDAAPAATSGTEAGANGAGLRAEPSDRLTSQSSADTREDVVTEAKTDADQASAEEGATASEEAPAVTESADLPESASDGEFVVQLGSFSDERNAKALAESVESSGFDVFVEPLFSEQGTVWRVRVGPYASRELAGEATDRLRQRIGRDGLVMTK